MKDMTDETEISLQEIAGILLHCLWLIIGAAIIGALIAFLLTKIFITPQYAASASLYVYNTDNRETITQSDITTSQKLVETYIVIMQSDAVLNQVAEESALGYTAKEIKAMFTASAINNTEVFQITIKNPNPEHARLLANTFLKVAPSEIIRVVKAGSVETVDEATLPTSPVSPNTMRNTLIGGLLGLLLSAAIVVLKEFLDTTIKTAEDIKKLTSIPIIGVIPTINAVNGKKITNGRSTNGTKSFKIES